MQPEAPVNVYEVGTGAALAFGAFAPNKILPLTGLPALVTQ